MTHTHLDPSHSTPVSDEEIIIDQEVRYADGSVRKRRETLSSDDPAVEARIERARLAMDRQLRIRDNDNAARGLLVGVIATTFLGLGILAWYILTNRQESETTPVVVPAQPAESSTPSSPPDINITLPNPPSAAESTVETAPTQPTIIQTQPAPSSPSSSETAPAASSEPTVSEPTGSSTTDQPSSEAPPQSSGATTP